MIDLKGKRIWRILEKSERTRDISLLEEAGKLLWEQVTNRPELVAMPDSSSCPREDTRNRQELSGGFSSTSIPSHGPTSIPYRSGRPKYKGLKSNKSQSINRGSAERGEGVVDYNKSVEDRGANEYRDRDREAFTPPTKGAMSTHTQSISQDIQSHSPSYHCLAQGQSVGNGSPSMVSHTPTEHGPVAHVSTHHTAQQELHSHPRPSTKLTVSQSFNSQSSDEPSLSLSPPTSSPLPTFEHTQGQPTQIE